MAAGGQGRLLKALDSAESKKDAGFKNNWSFDSTDESDGDVEKDEVNLLSLDESDGSISEPNEQKSTLLRRGVGGAPGDRYTNFERKGKPLQLRPVRGNATGLNMLGASKKLGDRDGVQNIAPASGTMVQGRLFHHTSITRSVKTAAQSQERRERKEYPPHVQKVEADPSRTPQKLAVQDMRLESDGELDLQLRRKVQPTRRTSLHDSALHAVTSPLRVTHTESMAQHEPFQYCTSCVKDCRNKTKCQSCGGPQRLYRQTPSFSESPASLARPAIHQNSMLETVHKGLSAKNFYGSPDSRVPMESILKNESRLKQFTNGKLGLSAEASLSKGTKNSRLRSTRSSEPNDPIILSSDDEDNSSTGSTSRIESISPRPADSACSSPVPSSGKVEAALRENHFIDIKFSIPTESDIQLPRKARMKDQFGNPVTNKRRKVSQSDVSSESLPTCFANLESIILTCRNVRVGTLYRAVVEPVVFCLDFIKIPLEASLEDAEGESRELLLRTSELTKCEWCCARKLSVIFFQTTPSLCHKLRSQFKMSRQNGSGWYDSRAQNPEEQYIVLIFDRPLSQEENNFFENILNEIGVKNSIPNFFSKIVFDEANRRIVAFTKHLEDKPPHISNPQDHIARNVLSETRMKLRNSTSHLKYLEEDEEFGETHNVFVGPIEKLIVYPPPPAKGGISVTNEDLHCLNEGEFLNDVIIDFYLKYLVLEKLRGHADKIHIFSSFFYKRLNQRERRNLQDTANLTLQQRRHARVKTWTRHVDIFQKDFIFVPLNEAAHWFLAVICFPGLEQPMFLPNPSYKDGTLPAAASVDESHNSSPGGSQTCQQSAIKTPLKKTANKKQSLAPSDTGSASTEESDTSLSKRNNSVGRQSLRLDQGQQAADAALKSPFPQTDTNSKNVNGISSEKQLDGLHRIQMSYSDSPDDLKKTEEELIDFSEDQDNLDESSDDGGLADDNFTSEAGKWHLKPSLCKQPCILLMDSLRGPSRSTVVKTLREYLEVEWEVRKGFKRSFSKDVMKGSNPRVPQQNNFSDCGVFLLQYVESFFENPIQSFDLPMNLTDWFPQQRMKTKREEIRNLILSLQQLQSKDKKGQRDVGTAQPAPSEAAEQILSDFETL